MKTIFQFYTLCSVILLLCGCQTQTELAFNGLREEFGDQTNLSTPYTEKPSLLILTNQEEITASIEAKFIYEPELLEALRALDYNSFFVVLFIKEASGDADFVTVQQVFRQGKQVTLKAEFIAPLPDTRSHTIITNPYDLIAVSKEGDWNEMITFTMTNSEGKVITETTHFVP